MLLLSWLNHLQRSRFLYSHAEIQCILVLFLHLSILISTTSEEHTYATYGHIMQVPVHMLMLEECDAQLQKFHCRMWKATGWTIKGKLLHKFLDPFRMRKTFVIKIITGSNKTKNWSKASLVGLIQTLRKFRVHKWQLNIVYIIHASVHYTMEVHDGKVWRKCWINLTAANPWQNTRNNFTSMCEPKLNN